MRYERFKIVRDTNTVYNRAVPMWEAAVLNFIFGDGNVQPTGQFEKTTFEYPEAGLEFDRLTRVYGADPQSGVPYVAAVYGNSQAGIRALKAAIEEAAALEKSSQKSAAKPAPTAKRRTRASVAGDALLA